MSTCPLCSQSITEPHSQDFYKEINCSTCGTFIIGGRGGDTLLDSADFLRNRYILSGITRKESECGNIITIDSSTFQLLIDSTSIPDGPLESMNIILLYLHTKMSDSSSFIAIDPKFHYPIAFAKNQKEFMYFLKLLER